jgi:hypothetical protein
MDVTEEKDADVSEDDDEGFITVTKKRISNAVKAKGNVVSRGILSKQSR